MLITRRSRVRSPYRPSVYFCKRKTQDIFAIGCFCYEDGLFSQQAAFSNVTICRLDIWGDKQHLIWQFVQSKCKKLISSGSLNTTLLTGPGKKFTSRIIIVYQPVTPWRNGSASDSRSEGCVFKSRRGQQLLNVY